MRKVDFSIYLKSLKRFLGSDAFAVCCILLTMVLFGLSFMFSRIALNSASVFSLLSWRFFAAFFLMTMLRVLGIWKIDLKGLPVSLLCIGLFQPILYVSLETLGLSLTSVVESGIITSTTPVMSMIMAVLFLREYPAKLQVVSIIVSVLGMIVVVLSQNVSSPTFSLPGYLALFGAVISAGFFLIFSRSAVNYSSSAKSYVMLGMGFIAFTTTAAIEHARKGAVMEWLALPFHNMDFLMAILFLGALTSVVGLWSMNFGTERLGVHRTSAFLGISTVVSVLAGVLLLREPFTLAQGVGAAMILMGVTGVNQFVKKS